MATGTVIDPAADHRGGSDPTDGLASQFAGVTTASEREELAEPVAEMREDAPVARAHDLADFGPARQAEFAAKGRRLRNTMSGECGYDGAEIWLPINHCCEGHDECEGLDDAPDSVFNGDACDAAFWNCVSLMSV